MFSDWDKDVKGESSKAKWEDSGVCIDSGTIDNTHYFEDKKCPFNQDHEGDTLLHMTIIQGLVDVSSTIISEAPSSHYLDITNNLFQCPLHLATLTKQYTIIDKLLSGGASIGIRNRHGNTALHIASEAGDQMALKSLINPFLEDGNVPFNIRDIINSRNYEGETCLHLGVRCGNMGVIEFLIHCGGDINVQDGKSGKTILHEAISMEKVDVIRFLLRKECSLDVKTYGGLTPMHLVVGLLRVNPNSDKLKCIYHMLESAGGRTIDSDTDYSSGHETDEDIDRY